MEIGRFLRDLALKLLPTPFFNAYKANNKKSLLMQKIRASSSFFLILCPSSVEVLALKAQPSRASYSSLYGWLEPTELEAL